MARGDTAQARINVTTNAEKAKNDIEEVNTLLKKLQKTKQLMMKEGLHLTADGKETATFKRLNRDIKDAQESVKRLTDRQTLMNKTLGNLNDIKLKELKTRYRELTKELGNFSGKEQVQAERWRRDLERIKNQIVEIEGAGKGASKSMAGFGGSLKTTLKNLVSYAGVFAGFNKAKQLVEGVFQSNLKLSDSLADIRKVAGLSTEAINQLYRNIAQIDSRNTIETLNSLAYTGAKLGIGQNYGVEGLTGFVKAAEQVQMALGEDMGEDALPALAKMTEVMGLIDKYGVEQSMQKAASAIFQLGATSTATGTNIVEFSKRLYGLANVSRVSADDLLALGSAADAMGLMPEVAATAFNKLFTSVQKNHNMIEKTLGLQPGLIKSYYDQGKTMDAIVKIFERMNETGNLNLLGSVFKDLGSDGARLVNVMATMSDRVDILKKHLETSRDAFKEGEAVIGEYMIQNQTAAAMLERASNLWAKAFTNPEGVDMVKQLAQAWYDLSKSMTQNEGMMYSMRMSIQLIALSIETLIKLMPILIQFMMFAGVGLAIRGVIVGFQAMVAAVRAATAAQMSFNAAVRSNALLALVSGVATAIAMFVEYSNAAEEATKRQAEQEAKLKAAFDNSKEAVQNVVKPLETYKKVLDEANLSEKQKIELVKDFRNAYQDYLDYLGIEVKTVDDLRDAYARVVEVMKIKKAYEERESYRTQVNGTNRMDRIGNQAQVEAQLRSMGVTDVDKEWLEKNQGLGTKGMYDAIMRRRYGTGVIEVKGTGRGRYVVRNSKGKLEEVGSTALYDVIGDYISSYRTENETNKNIDRMFDSEFTWTDASGKKRKLSEFDMDDYNKKVQEARYKSKGSLDNEAPDKDAIRAARKAAQDEKQALRKELQDAQRDSDAIISKIEEWYRLQEAVITGYAADGKWTQKQADVMIDQLNIAKNKALADARRGISGRDELSWEQTKQSIGLLMFDTSDMSQRLLDDILKVRLENVRTALGNIDKAGVEGISSTAMRDKLNKNAAGNLREVERIQKKSAREVEKMLKQYDYLQQAVDAFDNRLTSLGLLTESAAAAARRIQEAASQNPADALKAGYQAAPTEAEVQQQRRQGMSTAATRFIAGGARSMAVNYEDSAELDKWLRELTGATAQMGAGGMEFKFDSWAEVFREDFDKWLRESEKYKSEIQAFYLSLVQMSDDYTDATKKAFEREKKLQDQRFQLAGYRDQEERTDTSLERQGKMKDAGIGQTIPEMLGIDKIGDDPEILRIQNRIYWRNVEYEDAKRNLEAQMELDRLRIEDMRNNGATEQQIEDARMQLKQQRAGLEELLKERETALINETYNLTSQVAQQMQKRVDSIKNFVKPVTDFTQAAGRKIGDMIFNMESESATWEELWKNMALAVGQSVIEMGAQYMQNYIMQQSINRASESEAIGDANVKVAAGIAAGSAKTIGELGWWGIPLVAVISALLMGLLQSALSTKKSSDTATTAAKPKVKLVSGMLTYDEGNVSEVVGGGHRRQSGVQSYLGQDGRIYRATPETAPKTGLVTRPIATTVQGNPALVAERGPEIVIGRKTTRRIMMNEPGLLHYINTIERSGYRPYFGGRGLRTYDEGNLADVLSQAGAASGASDQQSRQDDRIAQALEQNAQMMSAFAQMMNTIQQQGLHAIVPKFGKGSFDEALRDVQQFRKKYPNG